MKQENYVNVNTWSLLGKDFSGEIVVSREQLDTHQILTVEIPDGRQIKVKLSPPVAGARLRFRGLINRGSRDLFLDVKVVD